MRRSGTSFRCFRLKVASCIWRMAILADLSFFLSPEPEIFSLVCVAEVQQEQEPARARRAAAPFPSPAAGWPKLPISTLGPPKEWAIT